MKKIYTAVAIVAMAFTVQAQDVELLNVNGSLENWEDATTAPEGWFIYDDLLESEAVARVEGGAQDGDIFVQITAPETDRNDPGLADIEIVGGQTYTISYYYKELNDGEARLRHWGQWRGDAGAITPEGEDPFQPSEYILDTDGEWTQVTVTSTAPEGATALRLNFRVYPQNNAGGGIFGIDNVMVYQEDPTSVKDNSIEGLSIYPNPATDMVNIVSNSLSNKDVVITDLLGKTVLKANVSQSVNVSALNAGVYMVQIKQDGKTATRKLIVK